MASTAATRVATGAAKVVKPIFSRDLDEAKRRVRELYRAWYREVPNTGTSYCVACKRRRNIQGRNDRLLADSYLSVMCSGVLIKHIPACGCTRITKRPRCGGLALSLPLLLCVLWIQYLITPTDFSAVIFFYWLTTEKYLQASFTYISVHVLVNLTLKLFHVVIQQWPTEVRRLKAD